MREISIALAFVAALVLMPGFSESQSILERLFGARATGPLAPDKERTLRPKDTFRECEHCPEMVVVPSGEFKMGSLEGAGVRPDMIARESPEHTVAFSEPFAVGKFEVTVDEFKAFVSETAHAGLGNCATLPRVNTVYGTPAGGQKMERSKDGTWNAPGFPQTGSHPVVCINWHDAKAYVGWLARKTGQPYRLLTEAEWEYAARAGTTTAYSTGPTISPVQAQIQREEGTGAEPVAVGKFPANLWGLYDVHGNVSEWVEDCWAEDYRGARSDGAARLPEIVAGRPMSPCDKRVLRGGSWFSPVFANRSAHRSGYLPELRSTATGFRVARALLR